MNATQNDDFPNVSMAVDHIIRAHGTLAVMAALFLRPFRHWNSARNQPVAGLSDHLLRDIGLDPPPDRALRDQRLAAVVLHGSR